MQIEEQKSLKNFNTFGIDCQASFFVSVSSVKDLKSILSSEKNKPFFVLGGGSNILLTKDIEAMVLHINLKGISVISENDFEIIIEAQGGENWHDFVHYCIGHNWGGIENLSLIPGNVGTAPIQNIGAYGVELKDVFESCQTIHKTTLKEKTFTLEECQFGYRDSIFKNAEKGNYIITSVQFRLTKKNHKLKTSYGAIQQELEKRNVEKPTIQAISEAVIAIRESKLPNPKVLGNSGSFFKNPVISLADFNQFRHNFPEAPFYEVSSTEFKIPAGWLIEKAGFKGQRFGDAGVHKNQALVLVNYGNAQGAEIWELAIKIQEKVKDLFGIYIEPEVTVI
ncbi:UDP-N-acetylmuramate dehydrogenase [Aureisphaera sp. CAU 1614]|uniref:UDP-N-acetylenolpyruvoylglucosamine reductase n=1 Tax=Halomarinibacterium sedimenti TaxID=2857106 RepID=A0A9X1JU92_9FLAO|nr:UDP-N-acetylmuramate dehydrogenase [Halomarinibacterium sedimenti]MBW2936589.1 UDP-N-acetylmuramate dehydrogenase [Halomarinibacterium sedimenti]